MTFGNRSNNRIRDADNFPTILRSPDVVSKLNELLRKPGMKSCFEEWSFAAFQPAFDRIEGEVHNEAVNA